MDYKPLERNKIYTVLPDIEAERDGDLRVIDESGEDYLFSANRFVARPPFRRTALQSPFMMPSQIVSSESPRLAERS